MYQCRDAAANNNEGWEFVRADYTVFIIEWETPEINLFSHLTRKKRLLWTKASTWFSFSLFSLKCTTQIIINWKVLIQQINQTQANLLIRINHQLVLFFEYSQLSQPGSALQHGSKIFIHVHYGHQYWRLLVSADMIL